MWRIVESQKQTWPPSEAYSIWDAKFLMITRPASDYKPFFRNIFFIHLAIIKFNTNICILNAVIFIWLLRCWQAKKKSRFPSTFFIFRVASCLCRWSSLIYRFYRCPSAHVWNMKSAASLTLFTVGLGKPSICRYAVSRMLFVMLLWNLLLFGRTKKIKAIKARVCSAKQSHCL